MNFSDDYFDDYDSQSFLDDEKLKSKVNKCKEYVSKGQTIAFLDNIEQTIQLCLEYDFTEDGIFLTEAALEISPYSSELWHSKGIFYNNLFEFEKAYKCFNKALSLNPSDVETMINKSIAEDNLDLWEEAIQTLETAITIEPNNEEAIFNLGIFYERRDHFKKAIKYFENTVKLDPEYGDAWYELGYCYENNSQLNEALNAYKKFLEIEPYSASGWYNIGIVHLKLDDYYNALNSFELAIAINDEFVNAYYNCGIAYNKLDRYVDARKSFLKAFDLDAFDKSIPLNIAQTYVAVGDYNAAIIYFYKTLKIDNNCIDAYVGLGNCFAKKNNYEEMLNNFSNVIKYSLSKKINLNSEDDLRKVTLAIHYLETQENLSMESLIKLAESYFFLGKWDKAIKIYKKILNINPESSNIYYSIALCLFMLNKNSEAINYLVMSFEFNPGIEMNFLEEFPELESTQLYIKLTDSI